MTPLRYVVTAIAIFAAIGVAEFFLWCSVVAIGDWVKGRKR